MRETGRFLIGFTKGFPRIKRTQNPGSFGKKTVELRGTAVGEECEIRQGERKS